MQAIHLIKVYCKTLSGRRGSNSRPSAWKADALSTELLPQINLCFVSPPLFVGRDGFEPPKVKTSRFTVCPIWPLWYLPFGWSCFRADGGIRTPDQLITNQLLWPTELHRQMFSQPRCKDRLKNLICKIFHTNFLLFFQRT